MIANFEMNVGTAKAWGLVEVDENGEVIGIYPHYVFKQDKNGNYISDGGITLGYGHWVEQKEYNVNDDEKNLIDRYANGASFNPPYIPENGVPYIVPNSSYVTMDEARELLIQDLQEAEESLNTFLENNDIELEQHEFDALISFAHQYGKDWWFKGEEKLMTQFIRDGKGNYDPEEVREVFAQHDYDERRAKEAEVFINGYQ